MIKKLLFAGALALAFNSMSAQVQVWKDDFNDEDISDWITYDDDGDGKNWGDIFKIQNQAGTAVTPISLISRSWQQTALTPDNWVISPAIDINGAGGALTLTWITQVAAADWDQEKYSVYVATSPDQAALLASPVQQTQTLGQGTNAGTPVNQTLDISAFIGQPQIYIAFRHHDVTDMDFISIDDVTVKATTLAVGEVSKTKVSIYPNPTTDVLNISTARKVSAVEVYDMLGRKVDNTTVEQGKLDVQGLTKGAYVLKVTTDAGTTAHKFIKN
ncbi:choice-of-anchor J domain-containing protein [Chryseobacterium sp. TY4]